MYCIDFMAGLTGSQVHQWIFKRKLTNLKNNFEKLKKKISRVLIYSSGQQTSMNVGMDFGNGLKLHPFLSVF